MDYPISMLQVKAARMLAEWSQADLAEAAGINPNTIKRYEAKYEVHQIDSENLTKITRAFNDAGISFVSSGVMVEGLGVVRRED